MRLSDESHSHVEQFFRVHRGDAGLVLPRMRIHGGRVARVLMLSAGMGAMTLGRHVFVRPGLLRRDARGRVTLPGWLVVHEAAHVIQYAESGFVRFLFKYLRGYWRALREGGRWDAAGRLAAYMAIEEEREAREAEDDYASRTPAWDRPLL
ncbi:MAG TPA: DUF4157 domain-containing protein [Pyrinomonadaceae bacterium]